MQTISYYERSMHALAIKLSDALALKLYEVFTAAASNNLIEKIKAKIHD